MISLRRSQKASSSACDGGSPCHAHEERLDHERPHARGGRDVVQDLAERNRRALDEVVVLVGAGFELGPDFAVVLVEDRQAALDVRAVEHAGVGDEDHFDGGWGVGSGDWSRFAIRTPHSAIRICSRLTSAHASMSSSKFLYVVGSPSPEKAMSLRRRRWGGDVAELGRVVDAAGGDEVERGAEFVEQRVRFDEPGFALAAAIDLAVDAVEVADLVGVEIHADRDAAASAG